MHSTRILYLEPFHGGSHAAFARALHSALRAQWVEVTLPARHWKWRMRGAAVHAALERADAFEPLPDLVFASSFVPLAELVGLRPELGVVPRVLYFHENQLCYPGQGEDPAQRDLHYGFTQLVSALAATRVVFNSAFNRDSFLQAAADLLARMPDAVPKQWLRTIEARSEVLPVPVDLPDVAPPLAPPDSKTRHLGPVIAWPHRWEHDKDPEAFVTALETAAARGASFRLLVAGERYRRYPPVFERLRERFADRIVQFGFIDDRNRYLAALATADIVVSTARHEFFGIAMLEATHLGAHPLVPERLVYPELYPAAFRYRDDAALVDRLVELCGRYARGEAVRGDFRDITRGVLAHVVAPQYAALIESLTQGRAR